MAEYVKHLKLHGKCTIIVVTTIVRFSTEESLETCGSIIFTNRVYSFQYPICKEKTVVSDAFWSTDDLLDRHIAGILLSITGSCSDAGLIKNNAVFPRGLPQSSTKIAANERNTEAEEVARLSERGINSDDISTLSERIVS